MAYVVPTKDHPEDLAKMLESLARQTVLPDQVVVVDASQPDVADLCARFSGLSLTYVRHYPPSLAAQRNAGMAAVLPDIDVAGYLDDDLVLEPDATERMAEFWRSADATVGGASFSIINQPTGRTQRFQRFFLMSDDVSGRVLASGFPSQIPFVDKTIQTEWLYGGATMWRREVIAAYSYDEWYSGYGFLEDVDYSYRVSRKYRLFVVGDARTWHFSAPMADAKQFEFGRQQTFNRMYFIRKMGCFSRPAVMWAMTGTVVLNLLSTIRRRSRPSLDRLKGNLVGLYAALSGRRTPFGGLWK